MRNLHAIVIYQEHKLLISMSQVLNEEEINIKTLMPEKGNNTDTSKLNKASTVTSKFNVLKNYSLSHKNLIRDSFKHKRNNLTADSLLTKKNSSNLLPTSKNLTYTDRSNGKHINDGIMYTKYFSHIFH